MLEACDPRSLDLVSLTLTSADAEGVAEAARHFAAAAGSDPGSGVFLVRDVGERGERDHFHGLALTREPDALRGLWIELAGGDARTMQRTPVSRWKQRRQHGYGHPLAGNVAHLLFYCFKRLPPGHGRRVLESDVIATGAFIRPWRAAQEALRAPPVVDVEQDVSARACEVCGGSLAGKRRDARYCGATHRKAASEKRQRALG
jgi:hypothetical protein